jgi:hypothetical protein
MKTSPFFGRKSLTLAGSLLLSTLLSGVAGAQAAFNFSPGGFTATNVCASGATPASTCQILTNGSPNLPTVTSGGALRLNSADSNQHASAWYYVSQPLNTGFTTAFQFAISSSGSPGDGLALVIQGDPAGTGAIGYTGNGQNMSYGNNDVSAATGAGSAILNSLAVELDTFMNGEYGDPDGNHIAVQSCASSPTAPAPSPNSADHTYLCANGKPALLGLESLPAGVLVSDGQTHTITVNYLPPGNCTTSCNNFSVYLDSVLVLQTTVDLTKQLTLDGNGGAYIGFTSATGASVENNDIVSWSYSQLPLAPITITQPVQTTTTTFNYTPTLTATVDYSQSGLPANTFTGVFMQGTVQSITDQQFADLVNNTPFQGSTCLHQDLGQGTYACVTTTDLCTTATNSTPAGSNCPGTASALIGTSNIFNADPTQKPIVAPGYMMGKDTALSCGAAAFNDCKGLINIFSSIVGDPTVTGKTKNFNSVLIPAQGVVQPSTLVTPAPLPNNFWVNQPVILTLQGTEVVPTTNSHPPVPLPTIVSINYSVTGANLPSPASGVITGPSGALTLPATSEGTTVVTFSATDTSGTSETVVTNTAGQVSTALPTFTIKTDKTAPVLNCTAPAAVWLASDVSVPCAATDSGSGLANPSQASFSVATVVAAGTETNSAAIPAVTVFDVAGNSASQGPFGPFQVDKKAPVISGLTISPAAPVLGQAVTASFNCIDGGSGVVLCGPAGSSAIAATANTGTLTSPADGSVGTHTFTVHATDQVGNTTASSVTYTVSAAAQLSISPTNIAFGNVKKFSINAKVITVRNTGTLPVTFSSIKLTQTESDGGPGREFVMLNGCGSKLAAQKSCSVLIGFLADEIVSAAGTVTFVDNATGSPQQVQISGNVVKR